jgi:hypothetical protein
MIYVEITEDEFIVKMWQSHEPTSHRFSDLGLSKLFEFLSAEDIEFDQDKVAKEWIEYETAEIANKDCNLAMVRIKFNYKYIFVLFYHFKNVKRAVTFCCQQNFSLWYSFQNSLPEFTYHFFCYFF